MLVKHVHRLRRHALHQFADVIGLQYLLLFGQFTAGILQAHVVIVQLKGEKQTRSFFCAIKRGGIENAKPQQQRQPVSPAQFLLTHLPNACHEFGYFLFSRDVAPDIGQRTRLFALGPLLQYY